jgi:N6-L-threonylcarbamoyladenine synthase
MIILGIETSCDETSVAIVEGNNSRIVLKSNVVASSLSLHAKTGGIIPEVAAREQLSYMLPVLTEAVEKGLGIGEADLGKYMPLIDAIAVTYGPGLIGSLLVGVETARTLAYVWDKPLIPVNHMMGHIYANWFEHPDIAFPAIILVVSGCHTDLLLLERHGKLTVLGGTRDDAAGEAFDKIGRLLGFPYPAGPMIEQRSKSGNPKRFHFPRPLLDSKDYDFSFSGLKTAVLREVLKQRSTTTVSNKESLGSFAINQETDFLDEQTINDLVAGTQEAVVDVLIKKTLHAAESFAARSIVLSGGVAANTMLRERLQSLTEKQSIVGDVYFPSKSLCTDNAAMIAGAAYFNYHSVNWREVVPNPELYYE